MSEKAEPKWHELKTWPKYFHAVRAGEKPFEIRKSDRDYKVGDFLILCEFDPEKGTHTGEQEIRQVTYLTDFAQVDGNVVLGIRKTNARNQHP